MGTIPDTVKEANMLGAIVSAVCIVGLVAVVTLVVSVYTVYRSMNGDDGKQPPSS